jgi:hypothetical protein
VELTEARQQIRILEVAGIRLNQLFQQKIEQVGRFRAVAVLAGLMLVVFCVAIVVTLARGIPIGCGCFTSVEYPLSWKTLLLDILWLTITVQIVLFPSALQLEDRLLLSLKEVEG